MISGEILFNNLLTVSILGLLFLAIYLKMTKKTIVDLIRDIRDVTSDKSEDIYNSMPHTFQDIR